MNDEQWWIGEVQDSRHTAPLPSSDTDWTSAALAGAVFLIWILVAFATMKVVELLLVGPA